MTLLSPDTELAKQKTSAGYKRVVTANKPTSVLEAKMNLTFSLTSSLILTLYESLFAKCQSHTVLDLLQRQFH